MNSRIWATSSDGLMQYASLTQNKMNEVLDLVRSGYFTDESLSAGIDLPQHPQAIRELDELTIQAAKDGVSLVALAKPTERVVGFMINKINVKSIPPRSFFEDIRVQHPSAQAYLHLNLEIDKALNLFELLETNCYFEPLITSVLPEFRGTGVFKRLLELSIQLCRRLKNGENVKMSLTGEALPLKPVPTGMSGIPTSEQSRKVSESLGFVQVAQVDLHRYEKLKKLLKAKIPPMSIIYNPLDKP